ncbi:nucleotidyltransferase family protein [Jeotgalibacillus salarius]|uniref:Nucleotidyltransferase family protein n=1 Tax=Jeotgalibacillus salarius TaxID=546023 RepID=A0A4Y8LJH8_9BACL|nr:nucleotidyltransferase family protein [Jeotgalibacillus salarius]TFE02365.1 nucleotidyltransferase family protein [Jeotgalibacillus salarius]
MNPERWFASDAETREILKAVQHLNLEDWWVCAGYIRKKIWDELSQGEAIVPLDDIDVIYFDPSDISEETEKGYEEELHRMLPGLPWSVKNQARMHMVNGLDPYESARDAIAKFPETVTALGIKLDVNDRMVLYAPHGLEDLLHFSVKPTPYFRGDPSRMKVFYNRLNHKKWSLYWPEVRI